MSTRKEKANKKKTDRQKTTIQPQPAQVNVTPELKAPEQIEPVRRTTLEKIEPVQGKATVANGPRGSVVPTVSPVQGPQQVTATTPVTAPQNPATKPQTFSDMLAPLRQAAIKEKTDAAKMQQYYALADALGALGKMGGTAIGGAVGGNVLDSAPATGDYQASRGYLDAFERAKDANDRLRRLDEQAFSLALSKQQRDEERAYNEKMREADRKYQERREQLNREWQQAVKANDLEAKTKVEERLMELKLQFDKEKMAIQAGYDEQDDARSRAYLQMQHDLYDGGGSGKSGKSVGGVVPVRFSNRKVVDIPTAYYDQIVNSLVGRTINDQFIDADNIRMFIEDNPQIISDYLMDYGVIDTPLVEPAPKVTEEPAKKNLGASIKNAYQTITPNPTVAGSSSASYVGGQISRKANHSAETTQADNEQDNKENDSRIQIDW